MQELEENKRQKLKADIYKDSIRRQLEEKDQIKKDDALNREKERQEQIELMEKNSQLQELREQNYRLVKILSNKINILLIVLSTKFRAAKSFTKNPRKTSFADNK